MNRHSPILAFAVACALVASAGLAPAADAAERGPRAERTHARGDVQRHTERTRTANGHVRKDVVTAAGGRTASREAVVVNDREAGTRTRDVTWTGPNGKVATREDVTTKTDTGYERSSTFTNPAGRTATRDATLVRDPASGTRTREATTTFPDGSTRTMNDVVQRTDSGYVRDTTIVNRNGGSLDREVTATRDPATGAWTKDVSVDRTPAPKPAPQPAPGG